jgi:hypothetical protein
MTTEPDSKVHTFCRYSMASCGIEVTVENNRVKKISADKQNPHTWQDFCAKGIFDPRGGSAPKSYGANRNLLVDGGCVNPLSQRAGVEFVLRRGRTGP